MGVCHRVHQPPKSLFLSSCHCPDGFLSSYFCLGRFGASKSGRSRKDVITEEELRHRNCSIQCVNSQPHKWHGKRNHQIIFLLNADLLIHCGVKLGTFSRYLWFIQTFSHGGLIYSTQGVGFYGRWRYNMQQSRIWFIHKERKGSILSKRNTYRRCWSFYIVFCWSNQAADSYTIILSLNSYLLIFLHSFFVLGI